MELDETDSSHIDAVGAKAAHLGELMRIDAISVPAGCCVTTDAFDLAVTGVPAIADLIGRLSRLAPDDVQAVRTVGAQLRRAIEEAPFPDDLAAALADSLRRFDERTAFAVRSSATAEDLPGASFAGQHDSYLNVVGPAALARHVRRCWASLFGERALAYRRRAGFADLQVRMAVVVQRMVAADAAGVVFTADPLTSNRRVATVEATRGLGEALVSGHVNGDVYRVSGDVLVEAAIAPDSRPSLTGAQVIDLVRLGRRIEAHFGRPQDIEWCLVGEEFAFVQSRPITTLFPVPPRDDEDNHVYVSVGHQQMMTDAMKPLGLSFWQMTTPAPMAEAGGRLFVDVTARLAAPTSRAALLEVMGKADPLTVDALQTVLAREGFLRSLPDDGAPAPRTDAAPPLTEADPGVVTELIARSDASVAAAARAIRPLAGVTLLDFIRADMQELRRVLFDPRSRQVYLSAMEATWWLNENLDRWLGERNAADTLTQSVPYNVTSQMGLALLDVADAIRPYPQVVAFLQQVTDDGFLDELPELAGGRESRAAIEEWLDAYGMRGVGEIDITRPRWRERPSALVPLILGNIAAVEPGAGTRRFEQGRHDAWRYEQQLLERVRGLPGGESRARETKRMIDRVRTYIGYREYPKYGMVRRYFVYKQALLAEADRLVRAHVLRAAQDIFFLTFDELHDVVRTHRVDHRLLDSRRDAFRSYEALTTPRVLTSDGEVLSGAYRRDDVPTGALSGLPVSTGLVEGRARVVADVTRAALQPGDVLVTRFTDPSWTPLFLTAAALVTEVGGLMTHGAVIAREYGLPAVVGVEQATTLIRDGQRLRVNGTAGYVELLD